MKTTMEWLALQQVLGVCQGHELALLEAIEDIQLGKLIQKDLTALGKEDRRILDQFAYRYTRLQDDLGAKLIPAVLRALGEEIAAMPMLDRLNKMEQLGWIENAEIWADLRRIRNEFTHDYPETSAERLERLKFAISAAQTIIGVLRIIRQKIQARFGN